MKKPFCDICGQPALEDMRLMVCRKIGEPWTGTRFDGAGVCDGTWQPQIRAFVTPQLEKVRGLGDNANPDLCAKCARELVMAIHDSIPVPLLSPVETIKPLA